MLEVTHKEGGEWFMGVISESGLKVSSVSEFGDDIVEVIDGNVTAHVNKGEAVWSGVNTAHGTRFNTLEGKDMSVGDEVTPVG